MKEELKKIKDYLMKNSNSITEDELLDYIYANNLSGTIITKLIKEIENKESITKNIDSIWDEYYEYTDYEKTNKSISTCKYQSTALKQYLNDINQYMTLSPEKEYELVLKGDENSKQELINHNLKLVVNIAKQYQHLITNMSLLDLIQEGNIGLMEATNKYQPDNEYKFSTYAELCIKQAITKGINNKNKTIKIPLNVCEILSKIQREKENYEKETGKELTTQNITNEILKKLDITEEQFESLNNIPYVSESLEEQVYKDENGVKNTIVDITADDYCLEEEVVKEIQRLEIRTILDETEKNAKNNYNKREIEIIRRRFGIKKDGTYAKPETISSIKKDFNITNETVRQIEREGLHKIRRNYNIKKFNLKNNNA